MNDSVGMKGIGQISDSLGFVTVGAIINIFNQLPGQGAEWVFRVQSVCKIKDNVSGQELIFFAAVKIVF